MKSAIEQNKSLLATLKEQRRQKELKHEEFQLKLEQKKHELILAGHSEYEIEDEMQDYILEIEDEYHIAEYDSCDEDLRIDYLEEVILADSVTDTCIDK
jgi:hypothetical protein